MTRTPKQIAADKVRRALTAAAAEAFDFALAFDEPASGTHLGGCCGQPEAIEPVDAYRQLWNHINGSGAWDANPWVVAYTFTVHHQNIDQIDRRAA